MDTETLIQFHQSKIDALNKDIAGHQATIDSLNSKIAPQLASIQPLIEKVANITVIENENVTLKEQVINLSSENSRLTIAPLEETPNIL